MAVNKSKKIALCGVMSAAAIVIMFLGSFLGIAIYAAPLIASVALLIITAEYGTKTSLLAYAAVSVIAVLIVPDRELSFFFVCFGWYQAIFLHIIKIKSVIVRIILKLAIYSAMIYLMYGVIALIVGIEPGYLEDEKIVVIILLVGGAAVFMLLDMVYAKMMVLWETKWKKRMFK